MPNSVAVLYFQNLSPDTGDAYVADGLTEEITARLGAIRRLRVQSRSTVQWARRTAPDDPRAVGRLLKVRYVVEGGVLRSGDRIRVTVRLVRAADGFQVWGDVYDGRLEDLLSVQEEIARAVATGVAGQLLPREQRELAGRPTANSEAYQLFLRANYDLAQRTPRSVARAIEGYEQALRIDPAFTQALARIAYSYALFLDWGWSYPGVPTESLLARGHRAAERAVGRAPTASDAWMALGFLRFHQNPRSPEGIEDAFGRAIALDPGNAEALHQYGSVLAGLARDSAAIAVWHRALALEPDRVVTLFQLGMVSFRRREYPAARRWLDSAVALAPGFFFAYSLRARTRLFGGDLPGARADAETALRLGSGEPLWGEFALVLVEARMGDTAAARARGERLERAVVDPERPTAQEQWHVGGALVSLGEHARALDLLERARPPYLWFALGAPEFDPIRSNPRFQRLVEESRPPGAPR